MQLLEQSGLDPEQHDKPESTDKEKRLLGVQIMRKSSGARNSQ